jgi:hypothetical protein
MKPTISIAQTRLDNMIETRRQMVERIEICKQWKEYEKIIFIKSNIEKLDVKISEQRLAVESEK